MLNIILLTCCILAGFLIGRLIKKRVVQRNELIVDLVRYTELLKVNINGKQLELHKFDEEFSTTCSTTFRAYLTEKKYPALNAMQKKRVEDFFANLNCVSGNQLLQHLDFYKTQFDSDLQASTAEVAKASVYVKLGILLGAMIGILFL